MRLSLPKINPQFVIDNKGKKRQVIMSIEDFEKLIEKLEDLYEGTLAENIKKKSAKRHSLASVEKEIFGTRYASQKA